MLLTVLVFASAVISVTTITIHSSEIGKIRGALFQDAIDKRLQDVFWAINNFPGSAGKDLLFLRTLSNENDIKNFIRKNDAYQNVFLFQYGSDCAMVIPSKTGDISRVCGSSLPTAVASALRVSQTASKAEIRVSSLVDYAGQPALLYSSGRNTGGIIISVINANYFLEEIRRLSRDSEAVFLLDSNGYYLAHPDSAKEKISGGSDNFYQDYPIIPQKTLDDITVRRIENKDVVFTFWRIYPTESNFAFYEGTLTQAESSGDDYWIMTAVSQKPKTISLARDASYTTSVSIVTLMHILMLTILCAFVRKFNRYGN